MVESGVRHDGDQWDEITSAHRGVISVAAKLVRALASRSVVTFNYDGKPRTVEVHAIGISTADKLVMRGYQTEGQSSRPIPSWALFAVDKIEANSVFVTNDLSLAPREGYAMGDRQMKTVLTEYVL